MDHRPFDDLRPDLVRRHADGELDPAEQAALEGRRASDSDAAADLDRAVAFEDGLRASVGRVMSQDAVPAGLRERIAAAMAAESIGGEAASESSSPDPVIGRVDGARVEASAAPVVETMPAGTGSYNFLRWMNGPRRANAAAVAAVVALMIGAIGLSVLLPSIDRWGGPQTVSVAQQAAQFAAEEHGRCRDLEAREAKIADRISVAAAEQLLRDRLSDDELVLPDLGEDGYRFIGAGPCKVPGSAVSVHAVWECVEGKGMVSCFVAVDNDFEFDEGEVQQFDAAAPLIGVDGEMCMRSVVVRRVDGLVVLIVCCRRDDLGPVAEKTLVAISH